MKMKYEATLRASAEVLTDFREQPEESGSFVTGKRQAVPAMVLLRSIPLWSETNSKV
jgi:hypothetical protein